LLSTFGNQSYYILIPLAVKAAKERFPNFSNAKIKTQDIKLVKKTITNKINKKYNNNNKPLSNSKLLLCKLLSKNKQLLDANYKLLSNKLLSNS
jgi:hypothetical protein